MATISSNYNQFGKQLCEILGLDPKKTRSITISSPPNDVVLVTAEQFLQDTEADKLILVLKEYKLIPKEEKTLDHWNCCYRGEDGTCLNEESAFTMEKCTLMICDQFESIEDE